MSVRPPSIFRYWSNLPFGTQSRRHAGPPGFVQIIDIEYISKEFVTVMHDGRRVSIADNRRDTYREFSRPSVRRVINAFSPTAPPDRILIL